MGNCGSAEEASASSSGAGQHGDAANPMAETEVKLSRAIDKEIRESERRMSKEMKLLLLGAGMLSPYMSCVVW